MRRALITGITGQDGSYLAELLLARGYQVHGMIRRSSSANLDRLAQLYQGPHHSQNQIELHLADMTDAASLHRVVAQVQPHEVYNLAAQSHVAVSFEQPAYTADVVALGALHLLEAVHAYHLRGGGPVRFYQAGSSEMFGSAPPLQSEVTPFQPRSPYAVAKVAAHGFTRNYRESYGMFAVNGILFNHESPRRGENFVTRKITRAAARIRLGLQKRLVLGNLEAQRDWGYAPDYVEAMWLMLQADQPDDFVVATGHTCSVKQFLEVAFAEVGLAWQEHVQTDARYLRPAEVDHLQGDASKIRRVLGWQPQTSFREMVQRMVQHDLQLAEWEATFPTSHRTPTQGT